MSEFKHGVSVNGNHKIEMTDFFDKTWSVSSMPPWVTEQLVHIRTSADIKEGEEGIVLTREQVAALIPLLQAFVDTGELPK